MAMIFSSSWKSLPDLPYSSIISTFCSMLWLAESSSEPTLRKTGSFWNWIAMLRTSFGHVAENISVCRSG